MFNWKLWMCSENDEWLACKQGFTLKENSCMRWKRNWCKHA